MKTILVTGFEPFGGSPINASWESVKDLNGITVGDAKVYVWKLPVIWDGTAKVLQGLIDAYRPELVINVGEDGGANELHLEKQANNATDSMPDNMGREPNHTWIIENGPDKFENKMGIDNIHDQLIRDGFDNQISTGIGEYLCNYVSYNSYYYLSKEYPNTPTMFIHVPTKKIEYETYSKAIKKVIELAIEKVS
ncbi:hypothetical protein KKHLCK_00700 [Candidatus Electrothrix laxa]